LELQNLILVSEMQDLIVCIYATAAIYKSNYSS